MGKRKLTQQELNKILDLNEKWLNGEADGKRADLRNKDLRDLDLRERDLSYTNLSDADLSGANLRCANLRGANLRYTDLRGADLRGANLRFADLSGAILSGADLSDADLRDAILSYADLNGADLRFTIGTSLVCPAEGNFVGFKKIGGEDSKLLFCKLEIPSDAKRSSATSRKCRCSKARVLEILDKDDEGNYTIPVDEGYSMFHNKFKYIRGEYVYPDKWDNDRWNECTHGIHFFMTKEEAEEY